MAAFHQDPRGMRLTAAAQATPRTGRFSSLFGPRPTRGLDTPDAHARSLVNRRLYDDIGDFLFAHDLAPTPPHFALAHAYLTGCDATIAHQIGAMIAAQGTLDRDRFTALAQPATGPHALAALADRLEVQLVEALGVADRSHSSARDYGDALDAAQTRLTSDPAGTLAHIAELTRDVVSATRLVENELEQTRRETERLRGDLDVARDAADRDHLTGLLNRRALERRVDELIARRGAGDAMPAAVIALCDIDDFKRINDGHGHQAGDRVLKFVGGFLSDQLQGSALVARHGGEEFAVLIEETTPGEAAVLLDAVRSQLAARSLVNQDTRERIGQITFSTGIAALDADAVRSLNAADVALYDAKRAGKNCVRTAVANQA